MNPENYKKNQVNFQTTPIQSLEETAIIKEQKLRSLMQDLESVLVAYSGGVDSAYLALIARQVLGKKAICITGLSPSVSNFQVIAAKRTAEEFDFAHETILTEETKDPNYVANPTNRCYFCKSELYGKLGQLADERGIESVIDGANFDDLNDYRPGSQAAKENNVRSLLAEVEMTKDEIRLRSKSHGLKTWDKPASPCLASRIQYGIPVSIERLGKVERGETILRALGFVEFRVRHHDGLARIEISKLEMEKAFRPEVYKEIAESFREIGFKYVTLDLNGFRTGSMNETIPENLQTYKN